MSVGPEGQLPRLLPERPGQRKAFPEKFRVRGKKSVYNLAVFLRKHGAGGVDQRTAGLHIPRRVLYKRGLCYSKCKQVVGGFIPNVRLFANDAKAGAGRVHKHHVGAVGPLGAENRPVGGKGLDRCDPQPRGALLNADQLFFVEVTGKNLSPVPHQHSRAKGLSARSGAHVDDPLSLFGRGNQAHQLRGGVLHEKPAMSKRLQRSQIAGGG